MSRQILTICMSLLITTMLMTILVITVRAQSTPDLFTTQINWSAANEEVKLSFASPTEQQLNIEFRYSNNEIVTQTLLVDGSSEMTQVRRATGKTLSIIDIRLANGKIVYSTWDSQQCAEGPTLGVTNQGNKSTRTIVNTTGNVIYFIDHSALIPEWQELQPVETYTFNGDGIAGYIEIRTNLDSFENCASFIWDFLPKEEIFEGYSVEIEDTPMFSGLPYFVNIVIKNLVGFRGVSGAIELDDRLQLIGQIFEGTLSSGMNKANFTPISNTNVLSFAIASNIPLSVTEGTLFRILVMATADYPMTSTIKIRDLQFSPEKPYKVSGGNITFGSHVVNGMIVDFYDNPLPNTNVTLTGNGWSAISGAKSDGTFQVYLQEPIQPYTLTFTQSRFSLINFINVQRSLNCVVGRYTCDTESVDTFDDGKVDLEDSLCIIDFWLIRPRSNCKVNLMQYDYTPKTFNQLSPGLHNMKVVGRLLGQVIVLKDNNEGVSAQQLNVPVLEFISSKSVSNGSVVTFKVTADSLLNSVGLVFSHNLIGSSDPNWHKDRLLLQGNGTNEIVAQVTVPVTQTMRFTVGRIYYEDTITSSDSFIMLEPTKPSMFMPFIKRKGD